MHPILFTIGPLPISSLGVLFVCGFILGVFFIFRTAREDIVLLRNNIRDEAILDIVLMTSLFGLLGARLFYMLTHREEFGLNLLRWFLFTYFPGLNLMGAIIFSLGFLFIFTKIRKLPLLTILDHAAFGFLLASPFGFVGSFLSKSVSDFPIQLIEAALMFSLFLSFLYAKKKIVRSDGILGLTFLSIFAIVTFGFAFFRNDEVFISLLTFNQWASLVLGSIALVSLVRMKKGSIISFLRKKQLIW